MLKIQYNYIFSANSIFDITFQVNIEYNIISQGKKGDSNMGHYDNEAFVLFLILILLVLSVMNGI